MIDSSRWLRFSTAMSAVLLLGAGYVLFQSAQGRFRSMQTFPLVFAVGVTLVLAISILLDRKPGRKSRATLAVLTIAVAALAPLAQSRFLAAERRDNEARAMEVLSGRPAPEIPYIEAIGASSAGASTFVPQERLTLLNFWATWCNPCAAEIPLLERFWREHRDAGFHTVGVTRLHGGREEQLTAIREFLVDLGVSYPVIVSDEDSPGHTAYRIRSLPTSVLVDRSGRLVGYGSGIDGTGRLLRQAQNLLQGSR